MTNTEYQNVYRQLISKRNNAVGHSFEEEIERACEYYRQKGIADIQKTPEPFRVMSKGAAGQFSGRFGRKAQPDFQGTLCGGRSIIFEAKSTVNDRIKRAVLTNEQQERLESHAKLGALAFVVVEVNGGFYTVPWAQWRDMKQIYGRQYMTKSDLDPFAVMYKHGVMFLDQLSKWR